MDDALAAGRRSFEQGSWRHAFMELSEADRAAPLTLDDLERCAFAAFLVGEDEVCAGLTERAHHQCLHEGDVPRAARCAFWLAFGLLLRGEMAPAGGWLARASQLLDEGRFDCVEQGYLVVPAALGHLIAGQADQAHEQFALAQAIGERFADADLITLGRLGRGQALVLSGSPREGASHFDFAMASVMAGEVSPVISGITYCAVIETCQLMLDVRRAREWTAALTRWCEAQPELVAYRGQCLVHRAEIFQLDGAWTRAREEAERACEALSRRPPHPAVAGAWYRIGELCRLRGELMRAEDAYRAASEHGHDPQPGLALLRLAQGQNGAAASAIRRAFDEAADLFTRARLLTAYVEIMLAVGEHDAARAAAGEMSRSVAARDAPVLGAIAAHAWGLALLAGGDPRAALASLRTAWATWRDLHAPYEAARARVAVGLACRALGDEDGANLEVNAAASTFRELGAVTDLAALEHPGTAAPTDAAGLSGREREVLRLLATGMTNRAIADELVVSQKTVARHVANIFTKLGVTSRSAATSYAYEHGLATRSYTP